MELGPGEFIMGYREFADEVGVGAATVHYWLERFETTERMIERKSNAKGTIITIKNWDKYQKVERNVEQTQNASETDVESLKKYKNEKNNKNNNNNNSSGDEREKKQKPEPKFTEGDPEFELALELRERIADWHDPVPNIPDPNPEDLQKWSKDMDRMLRLGPVGGNEGDGPSVQQVREILKWIYEEDDFWRDTIQSPSGIRKHLSKITAKIRKQRRTKSGFDSIEDEMDYLEDL